MEPQQVIGRYALFDAIAAGGMATVYYGRLLGPVGFARTVAIKQLHPQFSRDPDFVSMFVDEARLAARLRHPNVVPVLDVVKHGRELYLIMDYVLGVSLSELLRRLALRGDKIPLPVVSAVIVGALEGLHAAHETRGEAGAPLGIVHRDVSPANILVGGDGLARVLDFGIAKAAGRAQVTRHGEVKGKVGYMAPEQLRGDVVTRAADVYAVAVTLWECLTGRRGFAGDPESIIDARLDGTLLAPPSSVDEQLAPFDDVVRRGVAEEPSDRWPTARDMAEALSAVQPPATTTAVARWLEDEASELIEQRGRVVASLEAGASGSEIRAAIRKDLALGDPSLHVETWTGDEEELAGLWSSSSQAFAASDAGLAPAPDASGSMGDSQRNEVPTVVDASTSSPSQRDATRGSVPGPAADTFAESTTLIHEQDSTPPWLEERPRPSAASAEGASRRGPWPMWAVVGVTASLVVGAVTVAMFLRSDGAPETTPSAPRVAPGTQDAAPAGALGEPPSTISPESEAEPLPDPDDPAPSTETPPPRAATQAEPTASTSTVARPPPEARPPAPPPTTSPESKPEPKPTDPFDALGGRH